MTKYIDTEILELQKAKIVPYDSHNGIPPRPTIAELVAAETREVDPNGIDPHAPGAKLDAGKLKPWLTLTGFSRALREVSRVTTKGAEKYTPHGWASVENGAERYMEAFGRHLLDLAEGKIMDDGPKGLGPDIYHKASMIWNLLASLELELRAAESSKK